MNLNIEGKIAVVTAASKGLGRAVAEALAAEGVNVAICSRNKTELHKTANLITDKYKVDAVPIVCDVSKPDEVELLKNEVIKHFSTCHILFINAGGPPSGKIESFSAVDFQKAIDLNLMSAINLTYAFLPYMKSQKWGRILASTSSNVRYLLPHFPLSNVSRTGVVAFIKSLVPEYAQYNITANILAPGTFLTDLISNYLKEKAVRDGISYEKALEDIQNSIPARTLGKPADFGALAAYLSSEFASYINGEIFLIDGGEYSGAL